ncbi:MAG: hypothetical protein KGH58_00235 [Candidatus Micrarchaeota archaeon]|nr:hypothetical protein [Candidatus Micrarchaeota archaeon]
MSTREADRRSVRDELLTNPTEASVTRLVKQHPDIATPNDIVALLGTDNRRIANIIIENMGSMPLVSQSDAVKRALEAYALRSSRDPAFLEKYLSYRRR